MAITNRTPLAHAAEMALNAKPPRRLPGRRHIICALGQSWTR
jgi:hypothetical protein